MQLQQWSAARIGRTLRIDGLLKFTREVVDVLRLAELERVAQHLAQVGLQAGGCIRALDAPAFIDPAQAFEFGILVHHRFGAQVELLQAEFAVRDVTGNAHELFLPLQQAQAQPLLGVLDIPLHGLLLAIDFLQAQIPERRNDRSQEKQDSRQGRQHREPVLSLRCEVPPPAADTLGGRNGLFAGGGCLSSHGRSVGEADPVQGVPAGSVTA